MKKELRREINGFMEEKDKERKEREEEVNEDSISLLLHWLRANV